MLFEVFIREEIDIEARFDEIEPETPIESSVEFFEESEENIEDREFKEKFDNKKNGIYDIVRKQHNEFVDDVEELLKTEEFSDIHTKKIAKKKVKKEKDQKKANSIKKVISGIKTLHWKDFKKTYPYICSHCSYLLWSYRDVCEGCGTENSVREILNVDFKIWKADRIGWIGETDEFNENLEDYLLKLKKEREKLVKKGEKLKEKREKTEEKTRQRAQVKALKEKELLVKKKAKLKAEQKAKEEHENLEKRE
ncbi:hypothetical protein LCGC14_1420400 [marine sediment metagenome]|uniref:Uncharacterized protein n=1 Tax=marine sediment metagenome TaxID=412755 RepID=A0A0F9MT80_9ZZZZ|nr:hypothetical protein [bacterium]